MTVIFIWDHNRAAEKRTISMSLDPHVNGEVSVENKTAKLKMVINSREPKTTIKSWVWVGAFLFFSVSTLCGDFPGVLVVEFVS